ncbi:MAG: class I SAM-dependent methyltransferase [Oscillospiraceae bacterium]
MSYCDFAEFYDILTEDIDYKSQAKYLLDLLFENGVSGGILLDLACGTASLSIPLAKAGFDVVAVDESEDMLSVARAKIDEASQGGILLLCQSMQELELYGTVDAAICMLDSLNHLDSFEDVELALSKVSLFMNPDGIFIFDVNTPYKHSQILGDNTFVIENEEVFCTWQNEYDVDENTVDMTLDFFKKCSKNNNYVRTTQYITEKAYDIDKILKLLYQIGFEIVAIYDDMSKQATDIKTERAIFVARKVK